MVPRTARPEALFVHIFGEDAGFLVTFTGRQARLAREGARENELSETRQRSWSYPGESEVAAAYLLAEAQRGRDAYVAVHLFREAGNRLASNATPTVRALWMDEDAGDYPTVGPEPTAVVSSSAKRRHLYWRLTRPVAVEWAVAMNRRLAVWAGGDIGKAGLATVLRSPGTQNYKRHPQVDLVTLETTAAGAWVPEVLEQAVREIPGPATPSREPYSGPEVELGPYLEKVEVLGERADSLGVKYAIICPWIHEHTGGDRTGTRIGQRESGAMWFHCHHEHCQGRSWREFKRAVFFNRRFTAAPPEYTGPAITVEVHYE
jgi:hypothetical protein